MCDRMNMNMICWYYDITSQRHIVRLLREATATQAHLGVADLVS